MATNTGGGLHWAATESVIANCLVAGNWSMGGGGGLCGTGAVLIVNCMVAANWAMADGAGLEFSNRSTVLVNCTVASNFAYGQGGGVFCLGGRIKNTILWHDFPHEIYLPQPANLSVTYGNVEHGWPGMGNMGVDPLFVDPEGPDNNPATWEDNDYRLLPGSPCIDAGCNSAVPPDPADLDDDSDTEEITPLDLDGEGRFFDDPNSPDTGCGYPPIVDMGAYEYGDTGRQPGFGDFNGDRVIDLGDLATLLGNYGRTGVC